MLIKIVKQLILFIIGCIGIISIVLLFGARFPAEKNSQEIEAQYRLDSSSFVTIDGVRIHYTDQGAGSCIVLLHANYANLIDWEPWVETFISSHRVIRFDLAGHGLTSSDPENNYSLERTLYLFEKLMNYLSIDEMALVGASIGGTISLHYAERHPDQVKQLILVSPGALNPRARGKLEPPNLPFFMDIITRITPKKLVAGLLNSGFGDPSRITDELVTRWHDLLLREGQRDAQMARMRQYVSGDIDKVIANIQSPTLIMWGAKNSIVPVELADEMAKLLVNASSVEKIIYSTAGHQLVQEIGKETAIDAFDYLVKSN